MLRQAQLGHRQGIAVTGAWAMALDQPHGHHPTEPVLAWEPAQVGRNGHRQM